MADYRAYFVYDDGHFMKVIILSCANDDDAIKAATALLGEYSIEVWLLDRMVAHLKRGGEDR